MVKFKRDSTWQVQHFGEVQVSLFVAGAALGDFLKDSRGAKCCIFPWNMLVASLKSSLGFMLGMVSDHARISLTDRHRIVNDGSPVFERNVIFRGRRSVW